jgi:hypothetical protein
VAKLLELRALVADAACSQARTNVHITVTHETIPTTNSLDV